MFRRDSSIRPARRPPPSWLVVAALGAIVIAAAAVSLRLLAGGSSKRGDTAIEIALPSAGHSGGDAVRSGDPALIERGPGGPLPAVASDGREAWRVYARPFDASQSRPRIALVIENLGQTAAETEAAIAKLPPSVTLGFNPYAQNLLDWVGKARAAGHELVIGVPMEPLDYPREDPGPQTLLLSLSPKENLDRLEWALSRASGYVGVTNFMGARFTAAPNELRPIIEVLKGRGLLFLETRVSNESAVEPLAQSFALPHAANDRDLDGEESRAGIDEALADLEGIARKRGAAVGTGNGFPATIERIADWATTLEGKGLVLAPLTAVIATKSGTGEAGD
ncbi:MAG: divergent polysaccharide deacetylase family protein [Alphaproteobacteria bacterium]|nr:divergent polysaccharide deacetylase family protein [Alphaproteobacteria bacterium]